MVEESRKRCQLSHRALAWAGRLRAGLSGQTAWPLVCRFPTVGVKVSERSDGWLREAYFGQVLRRPPARDARVRPVSTRPRRPPSPVLPGARVRASWRSQRVSSSQREAVERSRDAPRDRRHPGGARQAASRTDAASRPDADERLRLRQPSVEARRLRHHAASERHARDHGADHERPDRAERHSRRRRAEVAGTRRRLSGRAVARDADSRGCAVTRVDTRRAGTGAAAIT